MIISTTTSVSISESKGLIVKVRLDWEKLIKLGSDAMLPQVITTVLNSGSTAGGTYICLKAPA